MKKILPVLLVISLSLTFLVVSIERSAYDKKYYLDSYERYGVEAVTNKPMMELSVITDRIIDYLRNKGGDELLEPYFNEREILHMRDVQDLFNMARWIKYLGLIVSLIILFYYDKKKERVFLGKTLTFGLFSNYLILVLLGIMVLIDFNKYFTYFHLIFFRNDLWLLDPSTDLLIQMLPEPFFIGMAKKIGLSFFINLAILQVIGLVSIRKGRMINEKNSKKIKR